MAPAPTANANRALARPPKVRYFKGKAPDAAVSDESSDEDEDEQQQRQSIKANHRNVAPVQDDNLVAGGAGRIFRPAAPQEVKVELTGVKVGGTKPPVKREVDEESEEESEEEEEEEEEVRPRAVVPKPPADEDSSEYETDSEEESEEEKKPAFRPVFVRKDQRGMTQEKAAAMAEEAIRKEEEMRETRKLDSKELAGETIRRELAEKEATEIQPDVDDIDGLDPAAEFDAWRARELARLLREKQAQAAKDEEREEIERRRALPEEQRLREDMEYAEATRAREKGQMGFLQKYYHKGAFHQDDELLQRDYTLATESQMDMSMLPKVMQVRNFGKMSRTKYTHLTDQDTSQGGWGAAARQPVGSVAGPGNIGTTTTGCWNCGGPHLRKDCPNENINDANVIAGVNISGIGTSANTAALGYGGGSRGWGGNGGGDRGERGGSTYREAGRERRPDEERSRYSDRDRERERDRDRGYGRDRDDSEGVHGRDDRRRDRARPRSRSPGRRDRESDRDDRRRENGRDRRQRDERERERDRDRDGRRYD